MTPSADLKQLERRAFTSYYQDGIWDLYLGFLIMIMPLTELLTALGASKTTGLLAYLGLTAGACTVFILAKKYITAPRLGQAVFSPERRARNIHLRYILGITATIGVIVFGLTILSMRYHIPGVVDVLSDKGMLGMGVGVFFTVVFGIMAYLMDFTRAYVMGPVFGAGIASALIFGTPVFMVVSGLLFVIIGSVLFVRFLGRNPLIPDDNSY